MFSQLSPAEDCESSGKYSSTNLAALSLWMKLWTKFLYRCVRTTLELTGRWLKFNFELSHFLKVQSTKFLLDDTVRSTKFLLDGTVPSTKFLLNGTVPSTKFLLDCTVPSTKFLLDGTVSATKNYQNLML